jgi:hypothetical protein
MLNIGRHLRPREQRKSPPGLAFRRPLVLLQSDDWGRVGVRDREGFEQLRAAGLTMGEQPYDFYTLEGAEDVEALHEMLRRHGDSTGRPPCLVMNFVLANVDFSKTATDDFRNLHLMPLADGLPGTWKRPGLFDAYLSGIADGTFYPALHGTTHFCRSAVERKLNDNGGLAELLRTLWKAETPYIYWRMPWIGYEYWNPEFKPKRRFLDKSRQEGLVRESAELFGRMFGIAPFSACAPGYRSNEDTCRAWEQFGIRVIQNGSGGSVPTHLDEHNVLRVHRNVDFEPATAGSSFSLKDCLRSAQRNLDGGIPAVVSVHSINFHSSLRDFRGPSLKLLDEFLSALERRYPDLLYIHDADLYHLANEGRYEGLQGSVPVTGKQ